MNKRNQPTNFARQVFSECGEGSFSRCATAFLILASVAWVSYALVAKHELPDLSTLTGLSLLIGTPYGLNQAKNVAETFKK